MLLAATGPKADYPLSGWTGSIVAVHALTQLMGWVRQLEANQPVYENAGPILFTFDGDIVEVTGDTEGIFRGGPVGDGALDGWF